MIRWDLLHLINRAYVEVRGVLKDEYELFALDDEEESEDYEEERSEDEDMVRKMVLMEVEVTLL